MPMMADKLILAVLLCVSSYVQTGATRTTYRAAVLEHRVLNGKTPLETMYNNVRVYAEQARIAAKQGADIIVFPEYGITGLSAETRDGMYPYLQDVPDPTAVKWNPCMDMAEEDDYEEEDRTEIVKELSCIARNNSIVVVANLGTVQICDNDTQSQCPPDNRFQFNTNLAFNANGTLVGVYHKHHLFNEPEMDPAPEPEYSIFDAGFAKFGMFTCFDIMFFDPAVKLVKNYGIRNIIFPTHWIDQLPFLTAIQAQRMWAYGMGVNLLAANCFHPQEGALGSGIYSSVNGAVNYTYDPMYADRLVIADVPIVPPPGPIFDPNEEEPPILHNTPLFIDLGTKVIRGDWKVNSDSRQFQIYHQWLLPHGRHWNTRRYLRDKSLPLQLIRTQLRRYRDPVASRIPPLVAFVFEYLNKPVLYEVFKGFGPFKRRNEDRRPKRETSQETETLETAFDPPWDLADNVTDTNSTTDEQTDDISYEKHGTSAEDSLEQRVESTTAVYPHVKRVTTKVPSRYRHYHLIYYEPLDKFHYEFLTSPLGQVFVCHSGLCCLLKYGISQYSKDDIYALVAFKGNRPAFSRHSFAEQVCAVVRCQERNISTCGKIQPEPPSGVFDFFRLAGNFTTRYVYPTMISPELTFIDSDTWEFHTKEVRIPRVLPHPNSVRRHHLYNLLKNNIAVLDSKELGARILTAGIYGRPYEDEEEDDQL